jgi:stage V sporulation protein R
MKSDWDFKLLKKFDDEICKLSEDNGLEWFDIQYEVCDYYSMIGHMSYHGMPTHYGHWSFGKRFERTHQMYNLGMEGLPYELIINSNPSIAYLMRENPAYMQILIMAHCVGHSDFFKNNAKFKFTRPDSVIQRMRSAKKRIQSYVENPNIGIEKVERFMDAAHAIQFQTYRSNIVRETKNEYKEKVVRSVIDIDPGEALDLDEIDIFQPEHNILKFLRENASLKDWQIDILEIIESESQYFLPQMKTKIMNEGWASFWHYRMCHQLNLDSEYHIPILKTHNQVVRPHVGGLNPYHVGFELFKRIEERHGLEECFIARETLEDTSFLRNYLTHEDCRDLGLFTFSKKKYKNKASKYVIDKISDKDDWKLVKNTLVRNVGSNTIPVIFVAGIDPGNTLVLQHEHDGRDLELNYADEVVRHISYLWGGEVKFFTVVEGDTWEI